MSRADGRNSGAGRRGPDGPAPNATDGAGPSGPPRGSLAESALGGAETAVADEGHTQATSPGQDHARRSPSATLVGQVLAGRYRVTRQLGAGGMGAVYEATHTLIGKRVAVKVLLDKYAERDEVVARLEQEAKLASSIGHQNIIDITDFGATADGRRFVVMEYLEGVSLGEVLRAEGPLPELRIVRIARQIASALGAAHAKGIIHRDIKPENVLLTARAEGDFVKVVDFGISKTMRRADGADEVSPRLTQTGMVLGTPLYMSPEQARGDDDLDHRIDIYALGVIMYELATGDVPFRGTNYLNIVSQVVSADIPPPSERRPELGTAFEAVTLKAMARDRDQRYASMDELAEDLAALEANTSPGAVSGSFWSMRRRLPRRSRLRVATWVMVVTVTVAAVAVAVSALLDEEPAPAPVVVTAAADAAPGPLAIAPPDAAPAVEVVDIPIESEPPGATVYTADGVRIGTTPTHHRFVRENRETRLVFELDDHERREIPVNPLTAPASIEVRLERAAQPKRPRRLRRAPADEPTPPRPLTPDDDTLGGELMGSPVKRKQRKQ